MIVGIDSSGFYTKTMGSFELTDFFTECPDNEELLMRIDHSYYLCDEHEYVYTEGLGITHYENRGFEWGRFESLVAWCTGNDTVGNLTRDEYLIVVNTPGGIYRETIMKLDPRQVNHVN